MHTFMTVIGLCETADGGFKWIPRLPKGWDFTARELPLPDGSAKISLEYHFPSEGRQKVRLQSEREVKMLFRAGPFKPGSDIICRVNGREQKCAAEICGEGAWGRIELQLEPGVDYAVEAEAK